jgi:diguanylate cyclase (GGDEF)-like protein
VTSWHGTARRTVGGGAALTALSAVAVAELVVGPEPAARVVLAALELAVVVPVAVWTCAGVVAATGQRARGRSLLDGLVALGAALVVLQGAVPLAVVPGDPADVVLPTVVQPVLAAVLWALGSALLCAVPAARRRAAAWFLAALGSYAVSTVAGAFAVGSPSPSLDVLAVAAHLASVATAAVALPALAGGPGATGRSPRSAPAVPITGLVVSHCSASAAVLLVVTGWAAGDAPTPARAALLALVVLGACARTLLWVADGVALTRQLPSGAGSALSEVPDPADRRTSERELERLAYTDFLTGLPNRARFMAELDAAAGRAAHGVPACLLLLDLDGFKAVNDVAGHEAGDHLLCEIADVLRSGARDGDLVARLGGDEFALLVPGPAAEATLLAERLVAQLDRVFRAPVPGAGIPGAGWTAAESLGPVFAVSGSIGVAALRPGEEATAAVRHADLALRAAKAAGKGCVRSSGEAIDSAMGRRARLARDLPAAIAHGQLRLVYQPVIGVVDRKVLGMEALVRWEHPVLGTVPPDEFIGLAEDDGLIVPLQQWVLDRATTDAAGLFRAGHRFQLAVNISVRHLQAGCLAPDVARSLAASGVPAENLVLEITESVVLDGDDRIAADLATLRGMGVVLALDDFGRGWSSLAYLARLPVAILKMDREFVADIERDPRGAALVASVIDLGRTLGMDVVAEGVETPGQAAVLQGMGCRYLQGHLFGRPVPVEQAGAAIAGFDPSLLDEPDPTVLDVLSTS